VEPPIIVYGAPRSGTTYLTNTLKQHPEVFISHETRVFVWAHESLNVLTQNPQALLTSRGKFVEHLREAYPKLIRDFYLKLAPRARYWGDKNPHYAAPNYGGCLDTIATLFPGTRFIHIIRDGRDVVTSLLRREWGSFENSHSRWQGHVDTGSAFGASQPSDRYFELRYEDLVHDDVGVARRLFDFLGISMHPDVVKFCKAQQEERTPLSGPTRDLSVGAATSYWEELLAPDQRLFSLELLGGHLVRYGYETEASLAKAKQDLARICEATGIHPIREVARDALPPDAVVLIAGERGAVPLVLDGRQRGRHFPQSEDGVYAGQYPADDEEAIAHLESLRAKGAEFLLFPATAFWWLEHYEGFRRHLKSRYRVVVEREDVCLIYDLRESRTERTVATIGGGEDTRSTRRDDLTAHRSKVGD
jgi:hypothetical protein